MMLSTLNSKLNLLAVGTNAKTAKGDGKEALTAIMYMAPNIISGYDVCPNASPGCIESCLFTAGRGAMTSVMEARTRKTKLYFEDNKEFLRRLHQDLEMFSKYCIEHSVQGFVRLNGTSDIKWEDHSIFEKYLSLNFYDYTKIPNRDVSKHKNYKLTYSRSEITTDAEVHQAINNNLNVAVVFNKVPAVWKGHKVILGDLTDMRWDDPQGVIVGLKNKGKAKKDTSGFVVQI